MTAELDWTDSTDYVDTFDFAQLEESSYGWDDDLDLLDGDEIQGVELPPDLLIDLQQDEAFSTHQEAPQDQPADDQVFIWTCVVESDIYG